MLFFQWEIDFKRQNLIRRRSIMTYKIGPSAKMVKNVYMSPVALG